MTTYRVGYSGSRTYPRLDLVRDSVRRMARWAAGTGRTLVVVSGTEPGPDPSRDRVDEAAIREARALGLATIVHAPDYAAYPEGEKWKAPVARNFLIVRDSDAIVGFWDGRSRGTARTLAIALREGKVGRVYGPGGEAYSVGAVGEMVRQMGM